ncbi:alpha/beta fold hydrolase [Stappia sp. ES.058]|uniref:alpha/beta fold hydrolase n=1 Tax=Stappia sp. ES.058 TaxID=1881061 RepID=UPI0012FD2A33|nr:alpha/beta hydrolase [Stappia sp. ES.058]
MMAFTTIGTGNVTLACLDQGRGPAIVALHGFPDTWRTWDAASRALVEAGYRVIRMALRGYAPSGIPTDGRYEVTYLAEDVLSLLDHLDLQDCTILGHDWGASTAYELALHAPDRLAAIVALSVPPPATATSGWKERLSRPHNLYLGLGPVSDWWLRRKDFSEVRRLYKMWSPSWTANSQHVEAVIDDLRPPERSRASVDFYRRRLGTIAGRATLPSVPSLLIYGSDEPKVRRDGFEAARSGLVASSRVVRIEGVGHWPHLEAPKTVLDEIVGFLGFDS